MVVTAIIVFGFLMSIVFVLSVRTLFRNSKPILKSIISCPYCGLKKKERMAINACQFYYECGNCKQLIRAKQGDCCVFCSYGTVKCPPKQLSDDSYEMSSINLIEK